MAVLTFGASHAEEYRSKGDLLSEHSPSFERSFSDREFSRDVSSPRFGLRSSRFEEIPPITYKDDFSRSAGSPSPCCRPEPKTAADIAQDQRLRHPDMSYFPEKDPYHPHYESKYRKHTLYDGPYPYDSRYMHGEPAHYFAHYPHSVPSITSISPLDIHRSPSYPQGECVLPSLVANPRKMERREPGDRYHTKRSRRRADEVERLYKCKWPGCDKGYGALNHLNTHVRNAGHGAKRLPKEFDQIRKEQKARLAKQRRALARNDPLYRQSGSDVFHYARTTTTSYEYPHHRPLDNRTYDTRPLRGDKDPYLQDPRY